LGGGQGGTRCLPACRCRHGDRPSQSAQNLCPLLVAWLQLDLDDAVIDEFFSQGGA
jgi:hypothetical protein